MYLVHLRGHEHHGQLGYTVHCDIDCGLVENYREGSHIVDMKAGNMEDTVMVKMGLQ